MLALIIGRLLRRESNLPVPPWIIPHGTQEPNGDWDLWVDVGGEG